MAAPLDLAQDLVDRAEDFARSPGVEPAAEFEDFIGRLRSWCRPRSIGFGLDESGISSTGPTTTPSAASVSWNTPPEGISWPGPHTARVPGGGADRRRSIRACPVASLAVGGSSAGSVSSAQLPKQTGEPVVRTVGPGLHAPHWNAEAVSNLGLGELSLVLQADEFAVLI